MTAVSRYKGGHLFNLYRKMNGLEKQIASKLAGMSESDFNKFELFKIRCNAFAEFSN